MFINLFVGIYTSRVILNALGFTDYGIYNLVGGIVAMLSFLNVGMTGASQRFLSYELGLGNEISLKKVFCTSIMTHYVIALIVIVFMETIGLWFVNYKLVIPESRMFAANWVFQCSIITSAISIISVPYSSCVVAHEKMGQFAYISLLETFAKLAIAVIILYSSFDRLVIYSSLILGIQILVRFIYTIYCKRNFKECTFSFYFEKELLQKMFAFAGWGCIGNMGFALKDQLSNVILNLFFGTTINAARGIATQVNGIISGFAMNFTMAMNPQITKQYAVGNIESSKQLAMSGSKYTFFLLAMVTIPFLINEHYILRLWLGSVPDNTDIFVCIILIATLIYSMSHTISNAILATGKVRIFQSLLSVILLSEVPIAYLILLLGGKPYMALLPCLVTNFYSLIFRILLLHKYIPQYSIKEYLVNIVGRCLIIFFIVFVLSFYVHALFPNTFLTVIITSFISILFLSFFIYVIGLNATERKYVNDRFFILINKIRK